MAFGWYKTVTIDHTQCGGTNSTNFPVVIWVTDADLKTVGNGGKVQNSNGYDIRPYADSGAGTPLLFDLVPGVYDPTTGRLELWVRVPLVSHTVDITFYLFFGDSGISTDGSSTATWGNNFQAVYHFGTSSSVGTQDSGPNGYTLTNHSATAVSGVLAGGVQTNGSSTYLINGSIATDGQSDGTLSMWINTTTTGGGYFVSLPQASGGSNGWDFVAWSATQIGFEVACSGGFDRELATVSYNDGNWHYLVLTWNGTLGLIKGYMDGSNVASNSVTGGTITAAANEINIGRFGSFGAYAPSLFDEVHVASVDRGADWITQEYNNQVPGSTFLSFGALTPAQPSGASKMPFLGA